MKNTSLGANFLQAYYLMRMHKPIGFWLLLWPSLMGLCVASASLPKLKLIILYTLGAFIMRSAGCVINDLADRNFDDKVARTKMRPLASKQVSVRFALGLFILLLSIAFGLFCQLNIYAQKQALIALILVCLYPFTKRFWQAPQLILGLSFAWSIPMAFAQIKLSVNYVECWLLFASIVCWVIAYDTQYALNDINDDLKIGIKSSAIFFGKYVKIIIFALQMVSIILLLILGSIQNYPKFFFLGIILTLTLLIHQSLLLKQQQYLQAFNKNNLVGLAWFSLILTACWVKAYFKEI